ncbi:MAG: GDP-mannose 4,6-dehydratase, partial [Melioribacteraceae bacterium]|nr:GDP-mannose 4,6-dehydratase [Melioribacteraceae bacterium]
MKAVVTGGAGFIGSHLTELLSSEEYDVHVIDNFRSGYKKNLDGIKHVKLHEGSITDPDLVNEVIKDSKYVFNLAALVSVPESIEQPDECI